MTAVCSLSNDLQTSFGNAREKWGINQTEDAFEFLTKLSSYVVSDGRYHPLSENIDTASGIPKMAKSIESVTFVRHSCIICKKGYYK